MKSARSIHNIIDLLHGDRLQGQEDNLLRDQIER